MGRGAPPWAQVKLRCVDDVMPPVGAELRIWNTGRRYQVIGVRGRTLRCLVLPSDAAPGNPVLSWQWCSRRRSG